MARRALAWISIGAGLTLVIILITGGFRLEIGPLRVSAHRPWQPLVVMVLAGIALARLGRPEARDALAGIATDVERHALSIAVVAAAAVAAVGVGYGTYAASAADPSAYVGHAVLLDDGRLARDEPLARATGWHEATWTFTPLGYRPGRAPGTIVPGYPLGLPLAMAAARRLAGDAGPFLVGPALAALAVLGSYWIAVRFASRRAAVITAVLVASSPIVHFQAVQPMSDVPAMAWWTLAFASASVRNRLAATGAGALAGLAILTRPNLAPLGAIVTIVAMGWPRADAASSFDLRRLAACLAGMTPAILALAAVQRHLYGSLLASGYGDLGDFFAAANVWPNLSAYARRLTAGEEPALWLAAAAVATLTFGRPRVPLGRRTTGLVALAAVTAATVLALYLPYGVFPDWAYFRFLLPALPLAFVALGTVASAALDRLAPAARGTTLLVGLTLVASFNVMTAAKQGAYEVRQFEARYRTMGRYLATALPPNAVIVTSQESGSARFYTGLPVLRWDLLAVDLEEALDRLRQLGRHPVLVVEDWEKPVLRARFPGPIASLDWPPRADVGLTTRVWMWDPADRASPPAVIVTDRLP